MTPFDVPYKLLIGPLQDLELIGAYAQSPQVKTFTSLPFSRVLRMHSHCEPELFDYHYDLATDRFADLLAQLGDWQPDMVFWLAPGFQAIPPGIENCPFPTVLMMHDWHLINFSSTWDYLTAFDFILGDRALMQILADQEVPPCAYWPCYSYDPQKFYPEPEIEKIYDIAFVGTLNPYYHRHRIQMLSRIFPLFSKYRVLISAGQKYDAAYRRVLNQSRIVLNCTVRREMNLRAYEAPACGALLFIEDNNLEIAEFLTPGQACVTYNLDNLTDLLTHYLNHESELQALAAEGHRQIQKHHYTAQFGRLLEMIPDILKQTQRPSRAFSQLPLAEKYLRYTRQIYLSRTPHREIRVNQLLDGFAQLPGADTRHRHLRALLQIDPTVEYLQNRIKDQEQFQAAVPLLEKLVETEPNNPYFRYNLGFAYSLVPKKKQALLHLHHSLEALASLDEAPYTSELQDIFPLGHTQTFLPHFRMAWQARFRQMHEKYLFHRRPFHDLMRMQIWQNTAHFLMGDQLWQQAEEALSLAIGFWPESLELPFLRAQTQFKQGKWEMAEKTYLTLMQRAPFYYQPWYGLLELYQMQNDRDKIKHTVKLFQQWLTVQDIPKEDRLFTQLFEWLSALENKFR